MEKIALSPCSLQVNLYNGRKVVVVVTAHSKLHKVLFLVLSVTFLFVYEISREPLNRSVPNSHGRRLISRSDELECQGHQGQKNNIFWPFWWPVYSLFGKTSSGSTYLLYFCDGSSFGQHVQLNCCYNENCKVHPSVQHQQYIMCTSTDTV